MNRSALALATAALRPARARIAWCMVGTALYQVGRSSRSQRKKRSASKPGAQTTAAPADSVANTGAIKP